MLKGIDVSYCQSMKYNNIDKSQVQFAIIRSSFGWEDNQKDSEFENHYKGFKNLGIPVGAYHYSYATNADEGRKEADYCYQCIKGKSFELPIYIDVEEPSVIKWGKRRLTDAILAFCKRMKELGYRAGVYTNPNWLENNLYKDEIVKSGFSIWLAQWESSKPYIECDAWQYDVGDRSKIDGVKGEIDLDYLINTSLIKKTTSTQTNSGTTKETKTTTVTIFDRDKFLDMARSYIGKTGYYVCITKLNLGAIFDWCAFAVSAIMKDCGFIPKYQSKVFSFASDNAREDRNKGVFFLKGKRTPEPADLIMFRYSSLDPIDEYSASHVGIVESVNGNVITTLEGNVEGGSNWAETSTFKRKTRYLSDSSVYGFFRYNWQKSTTTATTNTTNNTSIKTNNTGNIDATYKVFTCKRWQPTVKNTEDYAGVENNAITGVYCKPSKGHFKYRVSTVGGNYLPWVTDFTDFAGKNSLNVNIDRIQIEFTGVDGYEVEYRVSTVGSKNYLPWVKGFNNKDEDGYAGIKGVAIDKLQIRVVKK